MRINYECGGVCSRAFLVATPPRSSDLGVSWVSSCLLTLTLPCAVFVPTKGCALCSEVPYIEDPYPPRPIANTGIRPPGAHYLTSTGLFSLVLARLVTYLFFSRFAFLAQPCVFVLNWLRFGGMFCFQPRCMHLWGFNVWMLFFVRQGTKYRPLSLPPRVSFVSMPPPCAPMPTTVLAGSMPGADPAAAAAADEESKPAPGDTLPLKYTVASTAVFLLLS